MPFQTEIACTLQEEMTATLCIVAAKNTLRVRNNISRGKKGFCFQTIPNGQPSTDRVLVYPAPNP